MLDEMSMPKLKTKTIIPERMIIDQANRDLFSPIKVTDDVDLNGFKQMSAATPAGNVPQLKLKIPLNRSSTEKPLKLKKVNKDESEKKGLKLIIDKKKVLNTSDQMIESKLAFEKQTDDASILDLSSKSTRVPTSEENVKSTPINLLQYNPTTQKETSNVFSFDIDDEYDENKGISTEDKHEVSKKIKIIIIFSK